MRVDRESEGGEMKFEGIHHVTAITGDAPRNVDFYTRVLGLRLVKKTVNQDDPTVYHLFYAVRAYSAQPDASRRFLEETLGFESRSDARWEVRGEQRGGFYAYDAPPG